MTARFGQNLALNATAPPASRPASRRRVFPSVLAGVELDGAAARLAQMTDPAFLAEAGWDPAARVLSLPAAHPLLGRRLCRAGGCPATAYTATNAGLCWSCFARLRSAVDTVPSPRELAKARS